MVLGDDLSPEAVQGGRAFFSESECYTGDEGDYGCLPPVVGAGQGRDPASVHRDSASAGWVVVAFALLVVVAIVGASL